MSRSALRARRGGWARWRADLRLARRQVWRTKGSSLLVAVLIVLPVAGLSGAAVFWQSHQPSPAQLATTHLGRTQALFTVVGGPDPSRQQAVDEPGVSQVKTKVDGTPANPVRPQPANPDAVIPEGTKTIELGVDGSAYVDTATGTGNVGVTTGPAWDPAFTGRYVRLSGHAPTSAGQAMVSPGLLDRLGTRIGGTLTLTDSHRSFTITGTMRAAGDDPQEDTAFLPASAGAAVENATPTWFTVDWQPDWAQFQKAARAGFGVYARAIAENPPAGALQVSQSAAAVGPMLLLGGVAAVFGGYLVVLLAGAAFAVAARRQQRTLAVIASVGAARGDVFRVVLWQGAVLGSIAGVIGAALGVGGAAVTLAVTDRGVAGSFWGNWGLQVPWALVGGIVGFAVVVGTAAAVMPARAATRGDVLAALRGARRPARVNPRRPLWGLGLMLTGVAATVVGAVGVVAVRATGVDDPTSPSSLALLAALIGGPVLFQIGVITAGHWVLALLARGLSRLGLSARVAARDAAAHPSRMVPAFAAIAACVFVAAAAMSVTAIQFASTRQNYTWNGGPGTVSVTAGGLTTGDDTAHAASVLKGIVTPSHPSATALVATIAPPAQKHDGSPVDPRGDFWSVMGVSPSHAACDARCMAGGAAYSGTQLWIVDPADLPTIVGSALPGPAARQLSDGGAVALMPYRGIADAAREKGDTTLWLGRWSTRRFSALVDAQSAGPDLTAAQAAAFPQPAVRHSIPLSYATPHYPQGAQAVMISQQTAQRLGIVTVPLRLFAAYPQPPTDAVVDAMTAAAADVRVGADAALDVQVERGPASADPMLWLITGLAMVLVVAAGAVCLGLSRFERRPDDATLAAIGATRRLRRGIGAWQALIVVGLGTLVGTVAALISIWGLTHMSHSMSFADAPWPWLVLLAAGLPAGMAAASWLAPPREPDLTRRTAIA